MASDAMDVYIERGAKRTFASAVAWPGWSRSGRDEASALDALLASAPRYAKIASGSDLGFRAPVSASAFRVVERIPGDATTDFGAPSAVPKVDVGPVGAGELRRIETLITAAWYAFDAAVKRAKGKTLTTGPRGGGRSLAAMAAHVQEAEAGYLSALGWRVPQEARGDAAQLRKAVLEGLAASVRGEIPPTGPRGGTRWKPRKLARRLAWHAIDHAWELEDRSVPAARATAKAPSRSRAPAVPTRGSARARPARTPTRARR